MSTTYCYACDHDQHACIVCGHLAGHDGYCGDCEEDEGEPIIGPDCRDNKHPACDGRALDTEADELTDCDCYCHHWTEPEQENQ